jgi:hypothetical protein
MNDDRVLAAISLFNEQIRDLQDQLQKKKRVVNELREQIGEPQEYQLSDSDDGRGGISVQTGEFFTKPLATVVTAILQKRRAAGMTGPALVDEIYPIMIQGGFVFDAKNDANARRSLAISLSKNPKFVRLPSDHIALAEWYPDLPRQRSQNGSKEDEKKTTPPSATSPASEAKEDDAAEFAKNFETATDTIKNAEEEEKTSTTRTAKILGTSQEK